MLNKLPIDAFFEKKKRRLQRLFIMPSMEKPACIRSQAWPLAIGQKYRNVPKNFYGTRLHSIWNSNNVYIRAKKRKNNEINNIVVSILKWVSSLFIGPEGIQQLLDWMLLIYFAVEHLLLFVFMLSTFFFHL